MKNYFSRTFVNSQDTAGSFMELATGRLTLQPQAFYHDSQPVNQHKTFIEGIQLAPYKPDLWEMGAIDIITQARPKDDALWRQKVFNTLCAIVENAWDCKHFHVIAHSSGIDSRILSMIIKKLGYTDVLFVECAGEADLFLQIMQTQGWDKQQYHVFRAKQPPGSYFSHSFDCMPANFDGPVGYPVNHFFDAYDELIKNEVIPADSQFFAAFGCYIEQSLKTIPVRRWFLEDYYYQMHSFCTKGDWIFPWWNLQYLECIASFKGAYTTRRVSDLVNEILPKKIAEIPKYRTANMKARGWRQIAPALREKLQSCYDSTWYARRFPLRVPPQIDYANGWGRYMEAMICEQLIKKDCEIV